MSVTVTIRCNACDDHITEKAFYTLSTPTGELHYCNSKCFCDYYGIGCYCEELNGSICKYCKA